jgi:hypothetical protein
MKTLTVTLTGTSPLLMHSDRFANPLDPATKAHKELTGKRKKTDEDQTAIAKSEFIGGCYFRLGIGFYIPGQNFDSCLIGAAKLQKLGVKFKQGVRVIDDELVLAGVSAKSPEELWADVDHVDCRGVKVGQAKIMRYRPIFKRWTTSATVAFDEEVLSLGEVKKAVLDAGALIGLGDYRPRFGRFDTEVS